eukprot:1080669-Prymnesium_polylepis.1
MPWHRSPRARPSLERPVHSPPPARARQHDRGRGRHGGGHGAQGQLDAPRARPQRCAARPLARALPHPPS